MNSYRKYQRGVSLIEALVAFGVMAFGMLAVVGMQSVLRTNGDLARQRSEAVRIAQDYIEEWRGFSVMTNTANKTAYTDIISTTGLHVDSLSLDPLAAFNTVYTLTRTVSEEPVVADAMSAARKTLLVLVTWTDRNNQPQFVQLSTAIAGIEPALEGSLLASTNPDALIPTNRRYRGIPPNARDIGGGNSGFVPPGQAPELTSRIAWVFNNSTGVISLCTTAAASNEALTNTSIDLAACTGRALFVSGFMRYDSSSPPNSTSVVNPLDPVPNLGISIVAPAAPSAPQCFVDTSATGSIPYFCAVPISASVPNWSGNIFFTSAQMALASSTAPDVASLYKACRYAGVPATYTTVTSASINQNFVFIRAGSASTVFSCPSPVLALQPA